MKDSWPGYRSRADQRTFSSNQIFVQLLSFDFNLLHWHGLRQFVVLYLSLSILNVCPSNLVEQFGFPSIYMTKNTQYRGAQIVFRSFLKRHSSPCFRFSLLSQDLRHHLHSLLPQVHFVLPLPAQPLPSRRFSFCLLLQFFIAIIPIVL